MPQCRHNKISTEPYTQLQAKQHGMVNWRNRFIKLTHNSNIMRYKVTCFFANMQENSSFFHFYLVDWYFFATFAADFVM